METVKEEQEEMKEEKEGEREREEEGERERDEDETFTEFSYQCYRDRRRSVLDNDWKHWTYIYDSQDEEDREEFQKEIKKRWRQRRKGFQVRKRADLGIAILVNLTLLFCVFSLPS